MKIRYIPSSLMHSTDDIILHGVEDDGKWPCTDIGDAISKKWPEAREQYEYYRNNSMTLLGEHSSIQTNDSHTIINATILSSHNMGYVSYDAIAKIFKELNFVFSKKESIAMPFIGTGVARGHWPVILSIIEHHSLTYQPIVYTNGQVPSFGGNFS